MLMSVTAGSEAIDEVLATTRAVRRKLDFSRPVPRELLEECLDLALQAPTGSNLQNWSFVVVTDPEQRARIGEIYRRGWEIYETLPLSAANLPVEGAAKQARQQRIMDSARYLAELYHEIPAMVIACVAPRITSLLPTAEEEDWPKLADFVSASLYSSVIQATWSVQLAARARGLASCWTTIQLMFEKDVADVLGIPFADVQQVGLIALGYPIAGTEFSRGARDPLAEKIHWDRW
jgi:nitroreductase